MNEIHLNIVDSTQIYAKNHANTFPPNQITCIYAEEQTAGRGRYQRSWISPRGVNIYATFYFHLQPNTPHLTCLAQIMAYSFATLLIKEGLHPNIKWPNDVQLSQKKVSGVLCETVFHPKNWEVFLGIGINVNMEAELLERIDQPATSLKLETGRTWDKLALLKKLQLQFESDLEIFKKSGFASFQSQFENLLAHKGKEIRCFDGKKEWIGICHSLTQEGGLNLILPDQSIHTILSGDISTTAS